MTNGIEIKNLTLGYGEKPIISDMNIQIPKGKFTVIIGANGCGKSTLLKSIARILKPENGEILLEGKDVHNYSSKEIARQMSVLPQTPKAPGNLTVEELVSYGRFPYKKGLGGLNGADFEIIDEALQLAGIEAFRKKDISALSGGQRQRVWIAMTLCQKTDYMLLDEPTTYLDLSHQLDILSLLSRLNKEEGRTVVMVLHELNHAARFADFMIGMRAGEVIASGTANQVVTRENLQAIYQIDAQIITDEKTGRPVYLSYENISA